MYGFFPPEEAVPMPFEPSEKIALTFFRRPEEEFELTLFAVAAAEEEVATTLFAALGEEGGPTVFALGEGAASSFFAPAGAVGKKKFSSRTSCCPVWTS